MEGIVGRIGSNNLNLRALVPQNGSPKLLTGEVNKIVQKILNQTLADVLEQMSLPKNEHYEKLAQNLLEYNQPLQKETLEGLNRLLKQVGGEEDAPLLTFLQGKGVPLNKDLIQTIKTFFQEKSLTNLINKALEMAKMPPEIRGGILKEVPFLKQIITENLSQEELSVKLPKLQEQLSKLLQEPDLAPPEKAAIFRLLEKIKDFSEEKTLEVIAKSFKEDTPEVKERLLSQSSSEVFSKEKLNPKLLENLQSLLKGSQELEDLPKILKSLVMDGHDLRGEKLVEDLKRVVEHKREFGEETFLSGKDIPAKESLAKLWPDLKGSLEVENLLKYYQIPIATQEGLYQALIKVDREGKARQPGEETGERLVIFLETKNLGQIKIDLTAKNKALTFCFGVEEEEVKEDLQTNFTSLAERLSALDYQIREVSCLVQREKPEESYLAMEKSLIFSDLKKIDLLT